MNKQTKLVLARGIFFFFVIVAFGLIVLNEKKDAIMIPRVEKKINEYILENYKDIENDLIKDNIESKNDKYYMKLMSKVNNNHFFYIIYSNKEMTDTYKKDYIEGNNLYKYLKEKIETDIKNKTNKECTIEFISTFDNFTSKVQDRILKEDNLVDLKFYTIEQEVTINSWDSKTILKEITDSITTYSSNNIDPKNYKMTFTNKNDITQSLEISNITNDFINNKNNLQIINDILNDSNTLLLKESKITYKYLN